MKHFQHLSVSLLSRFSGISALAVPSVFTRRLMAAGAIAAMTNVAMLSSWMISNQSASGFPIPVWSRDEPTEAQFEACAETLVELGVEIPMTIDACGAAAAPKALSSCIADISTDTLIPVADALAGCVRVRRPDEMANCVVGLDEDFAGTLSSEILGHCSRSLLPAVFKNCVQGIATQAVADSVSTEGAIIDSETVLTQRRMIMADCVEADYDAPQVFLPTFQPDSGR